MKSNNKFAGVDMCIEQDLSGWYVKYIIHYSGKQLKTGTVFGGRTINYGSIGRRTRFYILREAREWAIKNGFTGAVARQMN